MKHQSPKSLKSDSKQQGIANEGKEEVPQIKDMDFNRLEEDHSSLLKKYEQLSKTKSEGYNNSNNMPLQSAANADQQVGIRQRNASENKRQVTPNKVMIGQQDLYQSAQPTMFSTDLGILEEKTKEERMLQQLVEDYKITNRDLSAKLDQERKEVLDQRVKIHTMETEIKFCKKENSRLTSMLDSVGQQKKSNLMNQNIQGNQSSNIVYSGSSFGEIPTLSNITSVDKQDLLQSESHKKVLENKLKQLEEYNSILQQEKQALVHQNRLMEERFVGISSELDKIKNISDNQLIKDKIINSSELSAKEVEILQLKDQISKLKKESQESALSFQQKITQRNTEMEKLLSLNEILDKQLVEMEKKVKVKEEQVLTVQSLDKQSAEKELFWQKQKDLLNQEIASYTNQIKILNDQLTLKSNKQTTEQTQQQKELASAVQEKEALKVQTKGQQETIQMLNQQIAILERISDENNQNNQTKKISEEKSLIVLKKELDEAKNKTSSQEQQIESVMIQNQNLQRQISLMEENKSLKKAATESKKKEEQTSEEQNYIMLIDQLQQEVCILNTTVEEARTKHSEREKQLEETVQSYKSEVQNLQSINAMFEKQILNVQNQLSEKKSEQEGKSNNSNNNLNEMKFLEERMANLQKQNELYSQKIQVLESRGLQQSSSSSLPRDIASKRNSALNLLEQGIQKANSSEGEEKFKAILKNYTQLNEQSSMQLKQIDLLNQTIQELQKTIRQNALQSQKNNAQNSQLPSASDFQDYQETSKKKLFQDAHSKDGFSLNNFDSNSPEKILIQDLEVQPKGQEDGDKQQLITNLKNENKRLNDKIVHVEQAFNSLNQKVEILTKQNNNSNNNNNNQNINNNINNLSLNNINNGNNLPPLPYPTTPVMTQNNMIFSKQFKSGEKPPQNQQQQQNSANKNIQEKDLSASKRKKIFEPYNRNLSSDRKSPNTRYLNNSIEIQPANVIHPNYQSITSSPNRTFPEGFGHKRQNTLPNAFNTQQEFYIDSNQVNTNQKQKSQQEMKRPQSFNTQNLNIFQSEQKQKKNTQNEESVLLFSPINIKKKEDDTDDLMSDGSVDSQMKKMMYPHLNVYEYFEQSQNNGNQMQNVQVVKFDRTLFSQFNMTKESLLKYKQAVFLSKIMYIETKEGLQIGCISQQERDQDQVYLNLNLFYKNVSNFQLDSIYVTLNGSSTCQAFAKPTVSNWHLTPNTQSKQELFFKFNSIPFGPIYADISYHCKEQKKKFQLFLPVNIIKFLEQRQIEADRLLSKYLKIKLNPKNTAKLSNGFILKSEKFYLDRKFALNINDFQQFLPHFSRIPTIDKLGEFMMGGNDFQMGGSYLLRENNLVFYMILTVKTNKYATFEIFTESSNLNNIPICENILHNFVYLFINGDM